MSDASLAVDHDGNRSVASTTLVVGLLATASLAFSAAFACATPFAGLAAVAATRLSWRAGTFAVLLVWLINQIEGFVVLHYPWTPDCFGWGVAIGTAALAALWAARGVDAISSLRQVVGRASRSAPSLLGLMAAFVAYETVIVSAGLLLPMETTAVAPAVLARVFAINVAAFAILGLLGAALAAVARTSGVAGHGSRARTAASVWR